MSKRLVVLAVVGIAALAAGSLAVIFWPDSPDAPSDSSAPAALDAGGNPLPPLAPLPPGPGGGLPAAGSLIVAPAPQQELLPEPEKGSWDAVPIAARASAMGAVGGTVTRELQEIQPDVAKCFDEDVEARHGQQRVSTLTYAPSEDTGSTVLVLQLETRAGAVTITDAPVETRGGAGDGVIACAQQALRRLSFPVPGAQAGQRFRMRYTLTR